MHFLLTLKSSADETAQKTKTILNNYVLELNFLQPSRGLGEPSCKNRCTLRSAKVCHKDFQAHRSGFCQYIFPMVSFQKDESSELVGK
jgi:hypothetical protein